MKTLTLLFVWGLTNLVDAQTAKPLWSAISEKEIKVTGDRVIIPKKYQSFHLANADFKNILFSAPNENSITLQNSKVIIELPLPDGSIQKFRVVESPVMAPELAAQFPDIKTFNVMGVDEPGTFGKLDWTELGFHAMIRRVTGDVFIDPFCRNNYADYITYNTSDFVKDPSLVLPEIGVINKKGKKKANGGVEQPLTQICAGTQLRKYRLAIACTHEYAQAATGNASPSTAQILSVVVTTVNRVDGVYETEAAIKLILIANETPILYGSAGTDPFTGNNNGNVLINESQTVIDNNIGSANYDIGHTFSTGGGGLAQLGVVCVDGSKGSGITGSPSPVGDAYDIDYVAHEMGHQFDSNHSYNECSGNATENPGTMVEPGSGITIMGYAGVCAAQDNLAMHSIAYFHTISYDEIMAYSNTGSGNSCPVTIATGNHAPVVTGSATYTVPQSTPFTLTGSATDADGDPLTYSWEEIDDNSTPHAVGTASPYFRSYAPTSSPSRMFPLLPVVLSGATSALGDYLPASAQTLNFRLTARDNKMGGGGVCYASSQVIIASSGPFTVTYPNAGGITWAGGSTQTITWNVNSTNLAPVSCANVNILLSTDGGTTFSSLLAATPNDGTQSITVPALGTASTTCRIKVECAGNIFFDISNNNFTISAVTGPVANVSISVTSGTNPSCSGASVTFTAVPVNGGTTPTYIWQVNGTNAGTGVTFTSSTLTSGQIVTCIMTSNLSGVVGSPATSNAITMTVGTLTPSITITGNGNICGGSSASFTAAAVNGGTTPAYQWQVNGTNTVTGAAFTSTSLTNGQVVTCILTSNATCVSSNTATSNSITIVITPSGTLPFLENFEGVTFPPSGWSVQNADPPSIVWGTNGAKAIERRPAAGNTGSTSGCAAINCYLYPDTVQFDQLISKPVSLSGASNVKMTFKRAFKYYYYQPHPGSYLDELRVYVSTDCGASYGPAVYYKKGALLASNDSSTSDFTPGIAADWKTDTISLAAFSGQTITIKFEIANKFGNNLYLDDINIFGSGGTLNAFVAIAGTNTICAGNNATFNALPTNGGTPSYQWKVNGVNAGTGASFTSNTLTNGQVVTCVMTSSLSGLSSNPVTSNSITITVNAIPPPASISQAGSVLTSSAASGNQWYLNGTLISGAVNHTYTASQNGTYTVIVTINGCSSAASSPLNIATGIDQLNNDYSFNVYPNPSDGNFIVSFNTAVKAAYKLELKNAIGQLVYQEKLTDFSGLYSKQLNISQYGKGIYLISLTNAAKETVKKVIVY